MIIKCDKDGQTIEGIEFCCHLMAGFALSGRTEFVLIPFSEGDPAFGFHEGSDQNGRMWKEMNHCPYCGVEVQIQVDKRNISFDPSDVVIKNEPKIEIVPYSEKGDSMVPNDEIGRGHSLEEYTLAGKAMSDMRNYLFEGKGIGVLFSGKEVPYLGVMKKQPDGRWFVDVVGAKDF